MFRVVDTHSRAGEIVYVGRGGRAGSKNTSMIASRVGLFLSAAMGFWTSHSGGVRFYKKLLANEHDLTVRDLEVCWKVDPDAICAEAEALVRVGTQPVFNVQPPRSCRSETCERATALWNKHKLW